MKKIGLVVKADQRAIQHADALEKWLKLKGLTVLRKESYQPNCRTAGRKTSHAPGDLFCVFVLGGDGTFLSAVRWIGDGDIPILGVKFGEVGFLAEIAEENLISVAETILKNQYETHFRMRLFVQVIRDKKEITRETVLNDVVINKGALARLTNIATYINDHYLTTYRADGLIVATPTGSTAYSLAAGGPIVHPEVPGIIMTPICPFTLTNRPLIVSEDVSITIRFEKNATDIMLTFDGQVGLPIDGRDTIVIGKAPHPVKMITNPNQQYFDVLKAKLRWSGGRV